MEKVFKSGLIRNRNLEQLNQETVWDVVIIGGGSTGSAIALDSVSRGFKTLLVNSGDFASGSSGSSTKLIMTGPSCLKGLKEWKQLREDLEERKYLLANAPHLVKEKNFVIPCYKGSTLAFYYFTLLAGLAAGYGGYGMGRPLYLRPEEVIRKLPDVKAKELVGGVQFKAVQFDDARLNIALIKTAAKQGAVCLNYVSAKGLERDADGRIQSVFLEDQLTGQSFRANCKMIFNAAGEGADTVRQMAYAEAAPLTEVKKFTCMVMEARHFEGEYGMLTPKAKGEQRLFCAPWNRMAEVGVVEEKEGEDSGAAVTRLIEKIKPFLEFSIDRNNVTASFSHTVVTPKKDFGRGQEGSNSLILTEFENMVTVVGGGWKNYRQRAEKAMTAAIDAGLVYKKSCSTMFMSIARNHHFDPEALDKGLADGKDVTAQVVEYAQYCLEHEFASCADDVLFRRLRIGQMSAAVTEKLRPEVEKVFA
ncbi:FAD-dependent oxidoreductase [Turicimonas muris]|uniref:FAD-dependent oxidoreductase n=2 Tax=Turicimonas muris TaxID=1796652 RepID=UPI00248AB525|nr:FAD-dependent oxidoreductase [Turicimonas muris]